MLRDFAVLTEQVSAPGPDIFISKNLERVDQWAAGYKAIRDDSVGREMHRERQRFANKVAN